MGRVASPELTATAVPEAESHCSQGVAPTGIPSSSLPPAKALAAELLRETRRDVVKQCWLGKAKEEGWRRTHPRPDVVHCLGAAAPAAQTSHPQHRSTPGWSPSRMVPALGRVCPTSQECAYSGVLGRVACAFCSLAPPGSPPRAPIGCPEQVAGPAERRLVRGAAPN